ncbi:hypothetical protein TNCV_741361 [Trichonephila clavipes]|nr:hypothetical protein TNCV_741361 [Trichonephila clavipes]
MATSTKQNCRIWSEANPQVYVETPYIRKLTVDCTLWAGGDPSSKNDEGHNVTVNGDRRDRLRDNIRRVIADIQPANVGKSHRKLDVRLDYIRASRGSPMPEIIFKM